MPMFRKNEAAKSSGEYAWPTGAPARSSVSPITWPPCQLVLGQNHSTPVGLALVIAGWQPKEAFPAGVKVIPQLLLAVVILGTLTQHPHPYRGAVFVDIDPTGLGKLQHLLQFAALAVGVHTAERGKLVLGFPDHRAGVSG